MNIRRFLPVILVLVFAQTAYSQFNRDSSNRLSELAGRLSREANDFAEANYRSYSNSLRSKTSDIEAVMLTQQLSGAAQVFNRMVSDRRRSQDLRDAFVMVQDLARSVDRNNLQRSTWYNIQRLLADVSGEIERGGSSDNGYPDQGRTGRMSWKGRVDDNVRITIRGGRADVETVGGTPYYDAQPNFTSSLPSRRVTVTLNVKRGRGQVFIEEQPTRDNDYAIIIRIRDTKSGADNYEFELSW